MFVLQQNCHILLLLYSRVHKLLWKWNYSILHASPLYGAIWRVVILRQLQEGKMNQIYGDRRPCGSFIFFLQVCCKLVVKNGIVLLSQFLFSYLFIFVFCKRAGRWMRTNSQCSVRGRPAARLTNCSGEGSKLIKTGKCRVGNLSRTDLKL